MRLAILVVVTLLCAACSSAPRAQPPASSPTVPIPTTAPTARPPTSTPQPDYRSMRGRLLTPLGALIEAVRNRDPNRTAAGHLADFNREADAILPMIESDVSKQANVLHSAITNVRAHPGDVQNLEDIRRSLLADI